MKPARLRSTAGAITRTLVLVTLALLSPDSPAALNLQLGNGETTDSQVVSNIWWHTDALESPSPFLHPGPFTARWSGTISVDLRGDYQFHADSSDPLQLEINGHPVEPIDSPATNGTAANWSAPVRLRKGTNTLVAILQHRGTLPAHTRLSWRGRGVPPGPIPNALLDAPGPNPPSTLADEPRRRGRSLFLNNRCGRCHSPDVPNPVPELAMDAPRFDDIGSIRSPSWMARWIRNPQSVRKQATMPRLLHGPSTAADAEAIAAWLSTLQSGALPTSPPGNVPIGRALSESLRCASCHVRPGDPADPDKISLEQLGERFLDTRLAHLQQFLRRPSARFAWTGMPEFRLTEDEARHLATFLLNPAQVMQDPKSPPPLDPTASNPPAPNPATIARGKDLVETLGCLLCHSAPAENKARPRSLAQLPAERWKSGCLAENEPAATEAAHPTYRLTTRQRDDLRAFAATDRTSLGRHVPADFASRWIDELRCRACHDSGDGIPALNHSGEKLRPEWTTRLLAGEITPKTRTWLPTRMPAFPTFAKLIAEGIAAQHGLPPRSPPENPIDEAAAADGRKLVSATGGLACVTCHAIGPLGATALFEAPGINFARIGERLLPDYFARWVRNPQLLDPTTKMPLYFDEDGNSALQDFYGGDGPRTIRSLWDYIRKGPGIVPPEQ